MLMLPLLFVTPGVEIGGMRDLGPFSRPTRAVLHSYVTFTFTT